MAKVKISKLSKIKVTKEMMESSMDIDDLTSFGTPIKSNLPKGCLGTVVIEELNGIEPSLFDLKDLRVYMDDSENYYQGILEKDWRNWFLTKEDKERITRVTIEKIKAVNKKE